MNWINVEDRMPDKDGELALVLKDGKPAFSRIMLGTNAVFFHIYASEGLNNVTHWMYLYDLPTTNYTMIDNVNNTYDEMLTNKCRKAYEKGILDCHRTIKKGIKKYLNSLISDEEK